VMRCSTEWVLDQWCRVEYEAQVLIEAALFPITTATRRAIPAQQWRSGSDLLNVRFAKQLRRSAVSEISPSRSLTLRSWLSSSR